MALNSLNKFKLKRGQVNFLMGVSGNGISTAIQTEIYSKPRREVSYLNYINLPSSEESEILLEIANTILNCLQMDSMRKADIEDFRVPFSVFKALADNLRQRLDGEVENQKEVLLIFDEFQRVKQYSNSFFFSLDKIISIGQIFPQFALTSVLISDEFLHPKAQLPSAGIGKLLFHYPNFFIIPAQTFPEMVSSSFSSKIQALSAEEQQHIYQLSGGIPSLINALVKEFATKQQELTPNYELEWMLHEIWESLGKENQKILKEILLGKKVQIEDRLQKQFLTVTGITSEDFEIIKPKLMESFTSKQINLEVLRKPDYIVIADKQIYLPDLTPQQEQILKLLIENEGKLVTRDDIAKKIWGEDHLKKYSDYAIDKQISKLRKYIKKSGINKQVISTKKGKGYVISAD